MTMVVVVWWWWWYDDGGMVELGWKGGHNL